MRKLFTTLALTTAITLGGCATFNPADIPGIITNVISTGRIPSINPAVDAKVNEIITQVQAISDKVCGFVPIASTVAGIIATLAGAGGVTEVASSIAQSICSAVTKRGAVRGGQIVAKVRGVPIQGRFTR